MKSSLMKQAFEKYKTPFYVFDTDAAQAQIQRLRSAFGANVDICYAMKANPFIAGALRYTADYFEVCSPGEFRICERENIPADKLVMSGVYKNGGDILYAVKCYGSCITYTVESLSQWNMLSGYARAFSLPIRVLLRLTSGNQFGLDRDEIVRIAETVRGGAPIRLEGIQYFSGTQKKSPERMKDELRRLDSFISQLRESCGVNVEKLEYGPGFPVSYFDAEPDGEAEILRVLREQLDAMRFRGHVVLELGRVIASGCGTYFTKVVDTKRRGGHRFCIVDGGIHQLNYYGQMMAMKKPPLAHLQEDSELPAVQWTVFGSLCTASDVLARDCSFSGLVPGSCLVFENAGAYSVTENMALFLSHDLPQIILYSEVGGLKLVRDHIRTDSINSSK